jgi:cell division protein ZapE
MTPRQRYQRELSKPDFIADPAQERAIEHLDRLYHDLVSNHQRQQAGLMGRFFARKRSKPIWPLVKGLYLWGGVGRGKTFLMDTFYELLPFSEKRRTHFHRFMRQVHQQLKLLEGEKNPLELIAEDFAEKTRVLCFDEFFVSDITDAMILAGLMNALLGRGVVLVATSNIAPDGLYRNGLQRSRFLPAIELINSHTEVVNVDGNTDYRLRALERAQLYYTPLGRDADQSLMQSFVDLAPEPGQADELLEVEGRNLEARWVADDVVWFDFSVLCDGPRSQNDYIELAREFHAVLLSNVPVFKHQDDKARRFINLVDEFYDRNVKLVMSAAAPLGELYLEGRLGFEFERTRSRLLEMQSLEYLGRQHLA